MNLLNIQHRIYEIRAQKVMLDFDLAELYTVQTKVLNQTVKRQSRRFPLDFMFRLTPSEWGKWLQENDTPNRRSQFVTASQKYRNDRQLPFAFTEQGLAMLSGILNSAIAIEVNIHIMRTFVVLRQYTLNYAELNDKLKELETEFDLKFTDVYQALNHLIKNDQLQQEQQNRKAIGF